MGRNLIYGVRKEGLFFHLPSTYETACALETRHAVSILRFAPGQAILGYSHPSSFGCTSGQAPPGIGSSTVPHYVPRLSFS